MTERDDDDGETSNYYGAPSTSDSAPSEGREGGRDHSCMTFVLVGEGEGEATVDPSQLWARREANFADVINGWSQRRVASLRNRKRRMGWSRYLDCALLEELDFRPAEVESVTQ